MNKTKTLKNTFKYHRIGQEEVPGNLPNFKQGGESMESKLDLQIVLNRELKKLIDLQKKVYSRPHEVSDASALGLLVSKACEWQGDNIFDVAWTAFEDSNYHSFNTNFKQLWEKQ